MKRKAGNLTYFWSLIMLTIGTMFSEQLQPLLGGKKVSCLSYKPCSLLVLVHLKNRQVSIAICSEGSQRNSHLEILICRRKDLFHKARFNAWKMTSCDSFHGASKMALAGFQPRFTFSFPKTAHSRWVVWKIEIDANLLIPSSHPAQIRTLSNLE